MAEQYAGLELLYDALNKACSKKNEIYLTEQEARKIIQTTETSLPPGTTVEQIYNQLEYRNLIAKIKPSQLEEEIVVPLKIQR